MAFLSTMKLQGLLPPITSKLNPSSRPTGSVFVSLNSSEPDSEPQPWKFSSKLSRWNRARALKSGSKLDRPINNVSNSTTNESRPILNSNSFDVATLDSDVSSSNGDDQTDLTAAKSIYIVSDGTGWTAEHAVNAALGQFDYCLVDRGCPVNTHLYSELELAKRIFTENPTWPVIEVTERAIEETAAVVLRLYDERQSNGAMPRISKCY